MSTEHNHDHDHDHHEGCGCGEDHEFEELDTITLTLEDDSELECGIIGVFEVESEKREYIALVSLEDERVLLYRYIEVEEDDEDVFELGSIETDEEFDNVSNVFNEIFVNEDAE